MVISIHQPNFLPWYPYFQKIKSVDKFVILTECQYTKNGFTNRFNFNDKWNTMSVNKGLELIKDKMYLSPVKDWNKIKVNLKDYKNILDKFDDCISDSLMDTNICIIKKMCKLLKIDTEIVFDYSTDLLSTDRLVDICKHYGASTYLSGNGGRNYLDTSQFGDIEVMFQTDMIKKHSLEMVDSELL
tara:strand:- start:6608 stop:7165 length:558 start_codon:yes stop_codon:yes gene_type:complete